MTPRATRPKVPLLNGSPQQIAAALQEKIRQLERTKSLRCEESRVSAGCAAIDQLLPERGLQRGWLTEWLGVEGGGAGTLALIAAREACLEGGALVILDRQQNFYPPAAAALGIDLSALLVLRPQNLQDELWALDQVLRCPGVAAVWAPLETVDDRTFRRWQLAAEESGVLGLLIRPALWRGRPSWSEVQFCVEPRPTGSLQALSARLPRTQGEPTPVDSRIVQEHENLTSGRMSGARRLRVELTRCRSGPAQGAVEVELDEVTGALREANLYEKTHPMLVAPTLADPTAHRRPTTA